MFYPFIDDDGDERGSFEVFYMDQNEIEEFSEGDPDHAFTPGYYWWACFPGCLPDSADQWGPFETEGEAIADAQEIG